MNQLSHKKQNRDTRRQLLYFQRIPLVRS